MLDPEIIGIGALQTFLGKSSILKPIIYTNDKTPSWDGEIFVYQNGFLSKDVERIPIQVKCSAAENPHQNSTKYAFSIKDLSNYFKDGGVLVFKILCNLQSQVIYYKDLLPSDLKALLDEAKEQKSKTITLNLLDTSSTLLIENICSNFLIHRKLQFGTIDFKISMEESKELIMPYVTRGMAPEDWLLNNEQLIYGIQTKGSIPQFIAKVQIKNLEKPITQKVVVGMRTFYENFSVNKTKTGEILHLGKQIEFDITDNQLTYSLVGSLDDQILDSEFLLAVIESKKITLGEENPNHLTFEYISESDEFRDRLGNTLELLRDIKKVLEILNINPSDLDISHNSVNSLDEKSRINLQILIQTFVRNEIVNLEPNVNGVYLFVVGNLKIGLFIYKATCDGQYKILNLFGPFGDIKMVAKRKDGLSTFFSPLLLLKSELLMDVANLDLDAAFASVTSIEIDDINSDLINQFGLELIKAYDSTKKTGFLLTASKIFEWLCEHDKSYDANQMNIIQISRRQNIWKDKDEEFLYSLREKYLRQSESDEWAHFLCGVSILLENKSDTKYYFSRINGLMQDEFKTYPIFTLGCSLGFLP